MESVPIKFRGETDCDGRETWIDGWQVYPHAVAQLVGYDETGEEICEGDAVEAYLADKFQRASTVNLSATAEVSCRGEALSRNPHYDFFVKGANHDD